MSETGFDLNTLSCSTKCPYFPNDASTQVEWVYDKENPVIKRRKVEKDWRCGYDGHIITNWYDPCPKAEDEKFSEKSKIF